MHFDRVLGLVLGESHGREAAGVSKVGDDCRRTFRRSAREERSRVELRGQTLQIKRKGADGSLVG
jgi:hypothetical protein